MRGLFHKIAPYAIALMVLFAVPSMPHADDAPTETSQNAPGVYIKNETPSKNSIQTQELPEPAPSSATETESASLTQGAIARVALLLPLSGTSAALGEGLLQSAQMALFDMADERVALVPYDTGDSPAMAESAARQAIEDGAKLILGPVFSGQARAVASIAALQDVPALTFSNDSSLGGNNLLVMGYVPLPEIIAVLGQSKAAGLKNLYALVPDNDYGRLVTAAAQEFAAKNGISLLLSATYNPQSTKSLGDAVAKIAELRLKNPTYYDHEALLIAEGASRLSLLGAVLQKNKIASDSIRILGTSQWADANWGGLVNLQGAWYPMPDPVMRADYEKRFAALYQRAPSRLGSVVYDATALAAVLAKRGGAAAWTMGLIKQPNGYAGVDGLFRFDRNGVIERQLAIAESTIQDAKIVAPAASGFSGQ